MYTLDPVGRLTPSSLDVSRAAAERHAHLEGLRQFSERSTRPARRARRLRPQEWLRIMVLPAV